MPSCMPKMPSALSLALRAAAATVLPGSGAARAMAAEFRKTYPVPMIKLQPVPDAGLEQEGTP
jgi:hypothetical protein